MSHGPLMPCPAMVSRTLPWLSRTSRQPAFAVAAMPLADGRLPTMTQPCTTASAVVSPMPPGQAPGSPDLEMPAKRVTWPAGEISTIVLPVPSALAAADHGHAVRVDVTVGRHRRREGREVAETSEERGVRVRERQR